VISLTPERISSLAEAAIAAPSADNRHVFRIEAKGDSLRLLGTTEFMSAPMSRRVLGLISIGAVAENLMVRAARLGLLLEPTWHLERHDSPLLVDFTCREVPGRNDPLDTAIEARHSNRRLRYRGPRLAPTEQERLVTEASVEGARIVWLDRSTQRRRALGLVRRAETERFRNQELHRELFVAIRFDLGWHSSAAEGLPPGSLELPWLERPAFSMLRHWRVQRIANAFGTHHVIGFRAADLPCRFAPHLCAITAEGDVDAAAAKAGRLLQRLWLLATRIGLSLQVFAAAPLYALEGATSIRPQLQRELARGWEELCPEGRPFAVVRLGYAKSPSTRAGRPSPAGMTAIEPSGRTG
jgi:hypothetical protein